MHTEALAPVPSLQLSLPFDFDRMPTQPAPYDGLRTPDEAQEVLARDWQACERQAILLGAFGVW